MSRAVGERKRGREEERKKGVEKGWWGVGGVGRKEEGEEGDGGDEREGVEKGERCGDGDGDGDGDGGWGMGDGDWGMGVRKVDSGGSWGRDGDGMKKR